LIHPRTLRSPST